MGRFLLAVAALSLSASFAMAWDGVDSDTGDSIEIGKGNLVRSGRDIQIYDHGSGEYRDVTVEDINRNGSTVEIEVYDNDTGEYRTFEMEDD